MEQDTEMLDSQNTTKERYISYQKRKNAVNVSIGSYKRMTSKGGQTTEKFLTWNFNFLHEVRCKIICCVCIRVCVYTGLFAKSFEESE